VLRPPPAKERALVERRYYELTRCRTCARLNDQEIAGNKAGIQEIAPEAEYQFASRSPLLRRDPSAPPGPSRLPAGRSARGRDLPHDSGERAVPAEPHGFVFAGEPSPRVTNVSGAVSLATGRDAHRVRIKAVHVSQLRSAVQCGARGGGARARVATLTSGSTQIRLHGLIEYGLGAAVRILAGRVDCYSNRSARSGMILPAS